MNSRDTDFQHKVEIIIENYLNRKGRKASINFHQDNPIDHEFELINKQFQKQNIMRSILQNIQNLIDESIDKIKKETETRFDHIEQEIASVKQMILVGWNENSQRTQARSEISFSSEIDSDSFLFEEKQNSLKKKLKQFKESLTKKIQHHDNLINMVIEQSVQSKHQIDYTAISQKVYESIWPSNYVYLTEIETSNSDFLENKYQSFKKLVEELKSKEKDKQTLLWNIVGECKNEVEQLSKQVNQPKRFFF